jgi:hypothetical protein
MEKITDKIAALPDDANYFSLEFFPPKTQIVGPSSSLLIIALLTFIRAFPTFKSA